MPSGQYQKDLIKISLRTLPRMLDPESGLFCQELSRINLTPSLGDRSLRYSIMSLLGLARARQAGYQIDIDIDKVHEIIKNNLHSLSTGDLGLFLWLNHRLKKKDNGEILSLLRKRLQEERWDQLVTMEVAWLLTGLSVHNALCGNEEKAVTGTLRDYFLTNRSSSSGLIYHVGKSVRRRFPNFATQIYSIHSLAMMARLHDDSESAARGVQIAERLETLQLTNGAWPWIYDAERGVSLEAFSIYSVHQDAMAPMGLLALREATGHDTMKMVEEGLQWMTGNNELKRNMVDPGNGLIYRSIQRKKPWDRLCLYAYSAGSLVGFRGRRKAATWGLEMNWTCRPYHLGWILEAWCGRESPEEVRKDSQFI